MLVPRLARRVVLAFATAVLLGSAGPALAQHEDERYVPETDPLVLAKLEQWQDLKFGLLMHWGAVQPVGHRRVVVDLRRGRGLVPAADPHDYIEYKRDYEKLQDHLQPGRSSTRRRGPRPRATPA